MHTVHLMPSLWMYSKGAQLSSKLTTLPVKVQDRSWPLKFLEEAIVKLKTVLDKTQQISTMVIANQKKMRYYKQQLEQRLRKNN